MEALIRKSRQEKALAIKPVLVLSDTEQALGLKKARALGVPAKFLSAKPFKTKLEGGREQVYLRALQKHGADMLCLAGFMRVVKEKLIHGYKQRMLNIHPSLLPKFKGLGTFKRVLASAEKEAGATVHLVELALDGGRILEQARLLIKTDDTAETLKERVQSLEYELYWHALRKRALFFRKKQGLKK